MTGSEFLQRGGWEGEKAVLSTFFSVGPPTVPVCSLSVLQEAHDCLMGSIIEKLSLKSQPERLFHLLTQLLAQFLQVLHLDDPFVVQLL